MENETAREMARIAANSGPSLDTLVTLMTLGQSMGQPQPTRAPLPQYQPGPYVMGQVPQQPARPLQLPGVTSAPYITPSQQATPAAGWGDILPYIGGQVYDWMTQPGAVAPGNGGVTVPGSVGELQNIPQVYTPTVGGYRAKRRVITVSPSGNLTYWRNMGQPILYSGDLAACKRVRKVASRARRAAPVRRAAPKRRR